MPARAPRILLITGTSPGEPGVGGVILNDLIQVAGVENIHCCWLTSTRSPPPHYITDLKISFHDRRFESSWRPVPGPIGEGLSRAATIACRHRLLRSLNIEIRHINHSFHPDLILGVLDSMTAIEVMALIAPHSPVPVHAIVWDDVDTFCDHGQLDHWTRRSIRASFKKALQSCQKIAVICENMQDAYMQRYGVNSEVLRHGMPETASSKKAMLHDSAPYTIGFAGSITTPDCIQSLFAVLDASQWKLQGRDIRLRMMGARYVLGARNPQWIEYFGWRNVDETRDLLHDCDALYLPQTFAPEKRYLSELSFPTKLSTYVAARVPIFLHAPAYASLSNFWDRYQLGPQAQTLDPMELRQAFENLLIASAATRQVWQNNADQAHTELLSVQRFQEGVRRITTPGSGDMG